MVSESKPPGSKADRPLWVIAFALLVMATCLVVLVLKNLFTEEPPSANSPGEVTGTAGAGIEKPANPLPPVVNGKRPSRLAAAATAEPPLSSPGSLPAPEPAPVDAAPARIGGLASGGFGPLSSLGQTNYRTAIIGQVVLHGSPPPEQPVEAAADAYCANVLPRPLTTRFYAVSTNGGLADVLVRIREGLPRHPPPGPLTSAHLQFANCQIGAYMEAVTQRQPLVIENKDATLHVLRVTPKQGRELVTEVRPHATASVLIRSSPELFIPCRCQLHPWETAYVSVLDHPFFSITDSDGRFSIANIPPGTYVLEAIHQKTDGTNGLTRQITIAVGQTVTNNFELEVGPPESPPAKARAQARTTPVQVGF